MSVADRLGRTDAPDRPAVAVSAQPPAQVRVVLAGLTVALVLGGLIATTSGTRPPDSSPKARS